MGAADIVPGVSGGTVALLLGIYNRLIFSLSAFARDWKQIEWPFLVVLGSGILTALLLLSRLVKAALEHFPQQSSAFFSGLVLASFFILFLSIKDKKKFIGAVLLVAFGLIVFFISTGARFDIPFGGAWTFLSGAIAIMAMILPGISGAFLLLLMGHYKLVIDLLHHPFTGTAPIQLALFVAGCGVGLLGFSNILKFLLKRYPGPMMMALSGMLLGSLPKLWPWQSLPLFSKTSGEIAFLVPYGSFTSVGSCALLFLAGLSIAFMFRPSYE